MNLYVYYVYYLLAGNIFFHFISFHKLDDEPSQNAPDLITRFHIYGYATRWAIALRRRIFKQKKGFANLSLGLNYHSKALPQPPSRDTVPLKSYIVTVLQIVILKKKLFKDFPPVDGKKKRGYYITSEADITLQYLDPSNYSRNFYFFSYILHQILRCSI
jgi:hypothetical protein